MTKPTGPLDLTRLISQLRQPEKRYAAIHKFRRDYPLDGFVGAYKRLFPTQESLQDYFGPSTPKKETTPYAKSPPRALVNTARELLWATARSIQSAKSLRPFIRLRIAFEQQVAHNDQVGASATLDQVEETLGLSVWLLQNRMALAYLSPSETEPSSIADAILRRVMPNRVLSVMMSLIRRRIEGAVSVEKQKELLESALESTPKIFRDYCRSKLLEPTNSHEQSVGAQLFYDSQSSAVDHYETLIAGLRAAVSDEKLELGGAIPKALTDLFRSNADERLLPLIAGLGGASLASSSPPDRALIIEAYTRQDYREAQSLAESHLSKAPEDIAIRVIYIKACAAMETAPSITRCKLIDDVNENLYGIFSTSKDFYRSVHTLLTLVGRFQGLSWFEYLRVTVLYEIGSEAQGYPPTWLRDIYVRDSFPTPFSIVALPEAARASILERRELLELFPLTVEAAKITLGVLERPQDAQGFAARNQARYELSIGNFQHAAELYSVAASSQKGAAGLRCLGGRALAELCMGQLSVAIDTVVNAFLTNPNAPTLLPLDRIAESLTDPEVWPNSINQSILLALAQQISDEDNLAAQRFSFECCQCLLKITKPTDLIENIPVLGQQNVIAYLDLVWRPEVMKQTLLYDDSDKIEEARIEVCRLLASLDPQNAKRYTDEMTSRVKQQEISKGTNLVEQSKVYVDVEAIKRALNTRLGTSYSRYKSTFDQSDKVANPIVSALSEVLADVTTASLPTILSSVHLIDVVSEPVSQADLQFDVFFSEITNEFLRGDHGLNAYLSTRVRHGKLIDALRKGVMDEGLVTARNDDGIYKENDHWLKPEHFSETQWREAEEALLRFSKEFDAILFSARDFVQIRILNDLKADDGTGGLFVYRSSWLERRLMQTYDTRFTSFDEFISRCVDSLWEKTDSNLTLVRRKLVEQVGFDLMKTFDELEMRVTAALGFPYGPLSNAIVEARTATQSALAQVVSWFNRSEVYDRADYAVDFPARIAANMARRTLHVPSSWEGPRITVTGSDGLLPGRTLDRMVDILYVLFENAVKRSPEEGIDVNCKISFERGLFECEVTNLSVPPTEDENEKLTLLRATLASAESRKLAQNEGRSGFRKIWNWLDHPLIREANLKFERHRDHTFKVTIKFKVVESNETSTG